MSEEKKIKPGPVILLILDGWGIAPSGGGNAITQAKTPNFKELVAKYPATILIADNKINIGNNYLALGTGQQRFSKNNLSVFDCLEQAGLKWQVLTEPEKLAYSGFFVNNKKKIKDSNLLVVSAGTSDDYQNSPAMAMELLTNELLKKIKSRKFDFILAVPANLDLVAHSGNFPATVEATEIIDRELGAIVKTVLDNSGVLLVTASHGHAEAEMEMQTELSNKKDTNNPVPLLIIGKQFEGKSFGFIEAPGGDLALVPPSGSLLDVLPTILKIMGLEIPAGLEGKALI